MKRFKIALAQLHPELGAKEKNLGKIGDVIEKHDADLYVFGELFITGYKCRDRFRELAEPIGGKTVGKVSNLAKENGASIVFGIPELGEDEDTIYNSCVVATPDGHVNRYRKVNLAHFGLFEEKLYFKPGKELEVFETPIGRLGCLVCYDLFFPEVAKAYAMMGAELLVCISAGPTVSREYFERIMPARALENTAFLVFCNLVGTEMKMTCFGGSAIFNPVGREIAKGRYLKEDLVITELDLSELAEVRRARPTLRDTRLDILKKLAKMDVFIESADRWPFRPAQSDF